MNWYLNKYLKYLLSIIFLLFFLLPVTMNADTGKDKLVYIIPIEDDVERGLESFINRVTKEAVEANADQVIFEIDTPGGRVDAAINIGEIIQDIDVPTTAFITSQALSAGSYIALNTDAIYMKPNATIGSSGVITSDGNAADKKSQSAWLAAMKTAASSKGRDPLYAAAMADPNIDLPEFDAPEGEYLTLGPTQAVEVGYAKMVVNHRTALLDELGLTDASIVEVDKSLAEKIAGFLTNPVVVPILLSLASIGLIVELFSPGFGIPGIAGLLSLVLFFYGHIVAGLAGYEAVVLLLLGIAMIVLELFVPGGIIGILGIGSVVGSLFLSAEDIGQMAMSIGIAVLVTLLVSVILFKTIGIEKGLFKHIILKERTTTELGYVSTVNRLELIGMTGVTVTPLRPSGSAVFDKERLDVISEGGFIDRDKSVQIIKTEGTRIVVREK
ncbi:NfeD family protein [Aquibacillus salsiterrae]|uniref:Nodulation protein NfeD n=1 Tax=Aquibacillus salsiterrae TaxID=2950439 RepID=A0A9X3WAG6_9BACI|nr:nodulation protein NfeD [Aquibacillus salsiterrae]MDC3415562.1 nodulation protein NfeD [Aquibacillus salsiterrae]